MHGRASADGARLRLSRASTGGGLGLAVKDASASFRCQLLKSGRLEPIFERLAPMTASPIEFADGLRRAYRKPERRSIWRGSWPAASRKRGRGYCVSACKTGGGPTGTSTWAQATADLDTDVGGIFQVHLRDTMQDFGRGESMAR
jgi:hypothetical protein